MWLIPLFLLIIFEGIADIFSKEWSLNGRLGYWLAAIVAYVTANIFWLAAMRGGSGLARGAALFSVASAVLAVGIGAIVFKENISTYEFAGVVLGILAIVLILWPEIVGNI